MNKRNIDKILPQIERDAAYLSDVSPSDKHWDTHKANNSKVSELYQELQKGKYAHRLNKCSGYLEFALKENSEVNTKFKLTDARFCRIRTCPVCQWRRTLVWVARLHQKAPIIFEEHPNHSMIFLTLTVKNCSVDELKNTIDWMNKAWLKLKKRKVFPGIGWIKSVEVTKPNNSEAHPHFHCTILVYNSYFKYSDYITQEQWTELWRKSLKVDYDPIVHVRKIKLNKKSQIRIEKELGRDLTETEKLLYSLRETVKYSVKESDLISNAEWLGKLTKQLHKTKAISLGGVFKDYLSNDEPEDLLNLESEDIELSETDAKFIFGWNNEVQRYRSI